MSPLNEFLDHREHAIAFDTVVTQLYEYDVKIDQEFYNLIETVALQLNIPPEDYSFMGS